MIYLIVASKPYTLCIFLIFQGDEKTAKFQLNFIFSNHDAALIRILELQSETTNTLEAINISEAINIYVGGVQHEVINGKIQK